MDLDGLIAELRAIRKKHGNVEKVYVFTEYPLPLAQLAVTGADRDEDEAIFVSINVSADLDD